MFCLQRFEPTTVAECVSTVKNKSQITTSHAYFVLHKLGASKSDCAQRAQSERMQAFESQARATSLFTCSSLRRGICRQLFVQPCAERKFLDHLNNARRAHRKISGRQEMIGDCTHLLSVRPDGCSMKNRRLTGPVAGRPSKTRWCERKAGGLNCRSRFFQRRQSLGHGMG